MSSDDMNDDMNAAERISRYIDGEMTEVERAAFEAELVSDPVLAEALARLTAQDERLRAAYALPVDDALLAQLGLAGPPPVEATDDTPVGAQLIDFAQARAEREKRAADAAAVAKSASDRPMAERWRWAAGAAMAAVVALAVALPLWTQGLGDPTGTKAFQVAMETLPSRTRQMIGGQATVEAQSSFADRAGRFCRDYVLGGSVSARGIACRSKDGQWQIEWQADGVGRSINTDGIRTAGGADDTALDPIYERLGATDPFDKTKENRLIVNGWGTSAE